MWLRNWLKIIAFCGTAACLGILGSMAKSWKTEYHAVPSDSCHTLVATYDAKWKELLYVPHDWTIDF